MTPAELVESLTVRQGAGLLDLDRSLQAAPVEDAEELRFLLTAMALHLRVLHERTSALEEARHEDARRTPGGPTGGA